jgi:hypothetical protein
MFNQLVTNRNKSAESPLAHPGAPPDSESARQPPMGDSRWEAVSVWPLLSTIRILFERPLKSK